MSLTVIIPLLVILILTFIVAIATFREIYKSRTGTNAKESEKDHKIFLRHIDRLKDRVANLETIVLEREKIKQFTDLGNSKD